VTDIAQNGKQEVFIANYQNGYVEVFETEPVPQDHNLQEEQKSE